MNIIFKDRTDAAKKLALALKKYQDKNPFVLAIPKGGVEIGYELSTFLHAEFSLLISRKLPLPYNPEAGFGAIAEDGSTFIIKNAALGLDRKVIDEIIRDQKAEIKRRKLMLRKNKSLPTIADKTVILTDDGIAMGSTMNAAIKMIKKQNPKQIVVAVPVASPQVATDIDKRVDDTVILCKPSNFQAVAQVYENWYDVPDEEVIEIMDKWKLGF